MFRADCQLHFSSQRVKSKRTTVNGELVFSTNRRRRNGRVILRDQQKFTVVYPATESTSTFGSDAGSTPQSSPTVPQKHGTEQRPAYTQFLTFTGLPYGFKQQSVRA